LEIIMADDLNKRGDALVAELKAFGKKHGGGHGGPPGLAPPWVHGLIDWLWDYFR
jgi:hypothetical protein